MIAPSRMSTGEKRGIAMQKYDYAVLALAALILAVAFVMASPEGSATGNRRWAPAEGIHLSGVHRSTANLSDEDFPPH